MIGKRKRDKTVVSRSTKTEDQDTSTPSTPTTPTDVSHDLFRKFFESQFEPLNVPEGKVSPRSGENRDEDESEESEAGSEWDGITGEEGGGEKVEVVEHQDSASRLDDILMDKKARKAFMNAKPPSFDVDVTNVKKTEPTKDAGDAGDDDEDGKTTDADNLKNDLALQRLLKESHLLESASELAPTGKKRHKALDMRMQSLGAKSSLYQQSMPSTHRRGIKAKASSKDEKRRQEAKENGIILEKPAAKSNPSINKRRERGVGGSSVGKFVGGSLNLSQKDVDTITSSGRRTSKGKGKGRRR